MHAIKLTPKLDPKKLQVECIKIRKLIRCEPAGYSGESHAGWESHTLYSKGDEDEYLSRFQYLKTFLDKSGIDARLVRLMVLKPGGRIAKHSDSFLSGNLARLHIPIITNDNVEFYINDNLCDWKLGEIWYGDFSLPHYGCNNGNVDRLHIVIDAVKNDNLTNLVSDEFRNIILSEEPASYDTVLDNALLRRFEFDFVLPKQFQLPGLPFKSTEECIPGKIRLIDSELVLLLNKQPMLKAIPVSEHSIALIGLSISAGLNYTFNNDQVAQVELVLDDTPILTIETA